MQPWGLAFSLSAALQGASVSRQVLARHARRGSEPFRCADIERGVYPFAFPPPGHREHSRPALVGVLTFRPSEPARSFPTDLSSLPTAPLGATPPASLPASCGWRVRSRPGPPPALRPFPDAELWLLPFADFRTARRRRSKVPSGRQGPHGQASDHPSRLTAPPRPSPSALQPPDSPGSVPLWGLGACCPCRLDGSRLLFA